MRNNKVLMAAIATALSASVGSNLLYAQSGCESSGVQLENIIDDNGTRYGCELTYVGESSVFESSSQGGTVRRPNPLFDFTGGESVLHTATSTTDGITFAAELFGGSVVLPTPTTTGSSADYMGVVYTIDGDIPVDFDAIFTLDSVSGAKFATNPLLGVRDVKGTGAAVTSGSITASSLTLTGPTGSASSTAVDSLFRFDSSPTLYLVTGVTPAPIVSGSPATINFLPLGNRTSPTAAPTGTSIFVSTTAATPASVQTAPVATISATGGLTNTGSVSSGTVTLSATNDASKFVSGWYYTCGDGSTTKSGSSGNTSLFTVTPNTSTNTLALQAVTSGLAETDPTATPTTLGKLVVGTTNTTSVWSSGTITAGECANSQLIYRVHVPGDTVISLNGTSPTGFSVNSIYQFHPVDTDFPHGTLYKVTNVASDSKSITIENQSGSTGLGNALKGGEKAYNTAISIGDVWNTSGPMSPKPPMTASGAANSNVASFSMNVSKAAKSFKSGDQLMLLYKLANVGKLAVPGEKINMTVDLKTGGAVDTLVNPTRTVTVAKSAQAMEVSLGALDAGKLNISVSSGSTQFSGENSPRADTPYGFINNTTARIGKLQIKVVSSGTIPKMADGLNNFTLASDKVTADNSKLIVTGGQFSASKTIPGKVEIKTYDSLGSSKAGYSADSLTQDAGGLWIATWNLDSSELGNIVGTTGSYATIEIGVDGKTEINSVENPPTADLTIDFNNSSYVDIKKEGVELRRITKDGNVCTVYNVPKSGGADVINIRVTNDSSMAGKLTGKLYAMSGEQLWSGDLTTEELKAGATVRFDSKSLEKLTGVTWDERAVLQISSTIPEMEVMALARQQGVPYAPLSNLSTGARGTSCSQD